MATAQKTVKKVKVKFPDKCSNSAVIKYISDSNGISKKQAKEIIEDVFNVINNGVLNGDRVNVGSFGKMFIRVRPATKERKGRNPLTGEEITIPAKKATKVPKFSFRKAFKETAKNAKTK